MGPAGELSPEEKQGLSFLEQAVAAQPDLAEAHLALAELLAPHAVARERANAPPSSEVSVARVLQAYGQAIQANPADAGAVEALIAFALLTERHSEAEAGFQELIRRDRENPEVLVRFGDFLAGPKGDREAALGVYAQALIWKPDDAVTRAKVADLHLDAAAEHMESHQYAQVDARLREARKYVGDPGSPQATRLKQTEQTLAQATGRR
jgi:tetratricopeptide (TPR) repeat protein